MSNKFKRATAVDLPSQSGILHIYKSVNLADAFAIFLPAGASNDPEILARFIFSHQPAWIGGLLKIRDALVAGLGLKTAKHLAALASANADRVGIFKVYNTSPTEIVLGEDDLHLDFRLSVLCVGVPASDGTRQLVVSTVVHCHNSLGRVYLRSIAPFHRLVVRSSLVRAASVGWPRTANA